MRPSPRFLVVRDTPAWQGHSRSLPPLEPPIKKDAVMASFPYPLKDW